MSSKLVSYAEVERHNTRQDCWCIIHGKPILKRAGKDATAAFDPIHPRDIIDRFLPKELWIGDIDPDTVPAESQDSVEARAAKIIDKPPISAMFNSFDFEAVARQTLSPEAWAYYSSGADDELTLQENHEAFHRVWLRPRVMIDVRELDTQTTLLGSKSSLPIYITATALGKLGHPEGEVVLTRAAGSRGIIQMMPTLASCSLDEMIDASIDGQTQWFQLYVNSDRKVTEGLIRHAEERGAKALFITVDAPQLGRREKDMRTKFIDDAPDVQDNNTITRNSGAARAISQFIDPALSWKDLKWFKSITTMPIMLKGIQCGEDAVMAAKAGVAGMVLSNHGGRQLDTARSGIEILVEVMDALRAAKLDKKVEIYVDGGFRRGTDIFKALALGAKAVGLGRPFLYAMSSYGQEGVEKLIDLLRNEFEMVMRLMGTPTIADIKRSMVITKSLETHAGRAPRDALSKQVYQELRAPISSKL
ncbi:hypothetical protein HK104_005659 [Borealophlyctis nickersoniae]|nr:hypothetical protein HK104_005659 [Borealophlyctis nickersoniae]